MISLKIEKKHIAARPADTFLRGLKDLKVGQSFLWKLNTDQRRAITFASFFLDRKYVTRAENGTSRVERIL